VDTSNKRKGRESLCARRQKNVAAAVMPAGYISIRRQVQVRKSTTWPSGQRIGLQICSGGGAPGGTGTGSETTTEDIARRAAIKINLSFDKTAPPICFLRLFIQMKTAVMS
jgi:hypothetical protein